jgi:hypothetical protein
VNTKEASRSLSYKESSPICERPLPYPLFQLSIGAIVSVLAGRQTARRPGHGLDIGWVPADNQPDRTICCWARLVVATRRLRVAHQGSGGRRCVTWGEEADGGPLPHATPAGFAGGRCCAWTDHPLTLDRLMPAVVK